MVQRCLLSENEFKGFGYGAKSEGWGFVRGYEWLRIQTLIFRDGRMKRGKGWKRKGRLKERNIYVGGK